MQRHRPPTQQYQHYTDHDFAVWRTLYNRQLPLLQQYGSSSFLAALNAIGFNADHIPNFAKVNRTLGGLTGWQLTVVPGLVQQHEFFELLAQKIFPATCWLRTMEELDYIEEPDMFHDVFGHVPLLANDAYAAFMQAFGRLALQWKDEPALISLLSRIYWFTIEFGVIKEQGKNKAYGAGIMSSPGELLHCMQPNTPVHMFDATTILDTAYRTDVLQEQYFAINTFAQLYDAMPEVEHYINTIRSSVHRQNTNI